jgi:hypothetical protein
VVGLACLASVQLRSAWCLQWAAARYWAWKCKKYVSVVRCNEACQPSGWGLQTARLPGRLWAGLMAPSNNGSRRPVLGIILIERRVGGVCHALQGAGAKGKLPSALSTSAPGAGQAGSRGLPTCAGQTLRQRCCHC